MEDLLALLELCRARAREYQAFELEKSLQGYCTLQMWRAMSAPGGQQQFADWVCALVLQASPERRGFSRHRGREYVGRDAVAALHALLHVQQAQSLDLQAFLDLLQRCGEERRLLELDDEVGAGALHGDTVCVCARGWARGQRMWYS